MAAGNFGSPVQLLILLVIVLLLFGGNRLRNLGGDLGSAIKGFKNAMASNENETLAKDSSHNDIANKEKLEHQPALIESNAVQVKEHQKI